MKRDPRDSAPGDPEGEVAPTAQEIEQARALSDSLDVGEDSLASALRASLEPAELDESIHEVILAKALGLAPPTRAELDGAPSDDEIARSIRLAEEVDAIVRGKVAREDSLEHTSTLGALAQAIRLAHAPTRIDEFTNERLLKRAVERPAPKTLRYVFAATAVVATLAASVMGIYIARTAPTGGPRLVTEADFARVRSTTDLFDPGSPFPREGGTSERIDRIAASRARDLRQNRFLAWGVE